MQDISLSKKEGPKEPHEEEVIKEHEGKPIDEKSNGPHDSKECHIEEVQAKKQELRLM